MRRSRATSVVLFVILLRASAASSGPAVDGHLGFLGRQLAKAKDPRARVQAALMLGESQEEEAMSPLCGALGDGSPLVRAGAARALGQLELVGAVGCLSARRSLESEADVRGEIEKSVVSLTAFRDRRPSLYVALLPTSRTGGNFSADLVELTDLRLRERLGHLSTLLAPGQETSGQAKGILKKKKLRGFQLRPRLSAAEGGGLRLNILCLSYPEQAVLGEVDVHASGAPPADLVRALVPRALEEAAQTFDWKR